MPILNLSGKRPKNLGVQNQQLRPSVSKPNNVCSHESRGKAAIKPLAFSGDAAAAWAQLQQVISAMPNAAVISATDSYLHAEFTTPTVGFVDDVECLLKPEESLIHIRSASRLGYSDWGVNRKRVEAIRAAFKA